MIEQTLIHVAVGVVINHRCEILISQRHVDSHQGGLWEFPGGKLEKGEDVRSALCRELQEELGIRVEIDCELLKVKYDYPEKSVLLDVWIVKEFEGEPAGKEGQPIQWVHATELDPTQFPPANVPIIQALHTHLGLSLA